MVKSVLVKNAYKQRLTTIAPVIKAASKTIMLSVKAQIKATK
jgi:hypothetical protein